MPPRVPSSEEALSFVEANGIVLESAWGRVPTFVEFVVGKHVTRWWSHLLSRSIFALTRVIRDSPEILTCRLVDRKVTYVHRRLWPALVKLSGQFSTEDLESIQEEHLPSGRHGITTTAFPQWVPAEVIDESEQLTEREAESLLSMVLRK